MEEPGVSRLVAVNLRGSGGRIGGARIVTETPPESAASA
jgi:hypothetical protein